MGYHPWGHKESDVTEGLTHTHSVTLSTAQLKKLKESILGFLSPLSQVRYRWSVLTRAGNLYLSETPDYSSGFSESKKFSPVRW